MVKGGGGAIQNHKYNPGIDFYSGFRKTSQGGGVQYGGDAGGIFVIRDWL